MRCKCKLNYKKDIFIRDDYVHRKMSAHISLPPINQINHKLFSSFIKDDVDDENAVE